MTAHILLAILALQTAAQYDNLEAVIETTRGQIVIDFFYKDAPRHVEYFVQKAREGAYDGTTFHRIFKYGLIQGGDPITKSKSPRDRIKYGTGGLNAGIPDEVNQNKHITGAVSATLALDRATGQVKPGSSGMQFFIVISPQHQLDSSFTVFGRVVSGMDVAADISTVPTDADNMAKERIEITKVTIREKTPTLEQMKAMTAKIETSLGDIKLQFLPESSPNAVREFIRYAQSGLYDGTTFFRVSQQYYMEAGNLAEWPQDSPNRRRFFSLWQIPLEKSDAKHARGTVSLRGIDGMMSWYFFIISQDNPALDGRHVPIGRVVEGMEVVDKIAAVEVEGDKPKQRIEIKKITIK